MSKKQSKFVAIILMAIVAVVCIYYVPRLVARTPDIPKGESTSINGYVSYASTSDKEYKTAVPGEMERFLEAVQALRIRYDNGNDMYKVGDVCADVVVRFGDGSHWKMVISDNGLVRINNKNYHCEDQEAVEGILEQIEGWAIS